MERRAKRFEEISFVEGINKEPNQNTLSRDRWTILKISNDLTELADIAGGSLSKKKGKSVDSAREEFNNDLVII